MSQVKSIQIHYWKKEEQRIELLLRGVFWPLWPLRGKAVFEPECVRLKLPFSKEWEVLPRERVDHLLLDKLGAGVFAILVLHPPPEPVKVEPEAEGEAPAAETPAAAADEAQAEKPAAKPVVRAAKPAPAETAAEASAEKPAAKPAARAAKAAPAEPAPEPPREKRYLGFFADPDEAQELGGRISQWGYGLITWLGNWRR